MPTRPDELHVEEGTTVVYTDGSCLNNPGRGGWAWAVPGGAFASGAAARSTNQRMEITAAIEAVRALGGPLVVVSDSAYVVNCFHQRWWKRWREKGWRNARGEPVANRDLWEALVELAVDSGRSIEWRKVQGHSGHPMNDFVDGLANEAAASGAGRTGVMAAP